LSQLGHQVKLMPPIYVKPYVKRGKTDAGDAAAISEAERTLLASAMLKDEFKTHSSRGKEISGGNWPLIVKVVWDKLDKKWSLFDLEADRTETNDLAQTNSALAKRLAGDWSAWAKRTGLNAKP